MDPLEADLALWRDTTLAALSRQLGRDAPLPPAMEDALAAIQAGAKSREADSEALEQLAELGRELGCNDPAPKPGSWEEVAALSRQMGCAVPASIEAAAASLQADGVTPDPDPDLLAELRRLAAHAALPQAGGLGVHEPQSPRQPAWEPPSPAALEAALVAMPAAGASFVSRVDLLMPQLNRSFSWTVNALLMSQPEMHGPPFTIQCSSLHAYQFMLSAAARAAVAELQDDVRYPDPEVVQRGVDALGELTPAALAPFMAVLPPQIQAKLGSCLVGSMGSYEEVEKGVLMPLPERTKPLTGLTRDWGAAAVAGVASAAAPGASGGAGSKPQGAAGTEGGAVSGGAAPVVGKKEAARQAAVRAAAERAVAAAVIVRPPVLPPHLPDSYASYLLVGTAGYMVYKSRTTAVFGQLVSIQLL